MSIQGTLISVIGSASSIIGDVTPEVKNAADTKATTPKAAPTAPKTSAPSAPPAAVKKGSDQAQSATAAAPQPKSRKKMTAAEASLKALQYTRDAMDQKRSNSMRTAMMANDRFGGIY